MFFLLPTPLRAFLLRCRLRAAQRKIDVIESLGLPEDLKLAAIRKVERQFEERLDRFTRAD